MRLCAIHQPNFFPWLGFFDKIYKSDVFVLMDDVNYPRSGSGGMGSWTNRVMIKVQGEAKWIRSPVENKTSKGAIQHVRISPELKWKEKLLRTLVMNYRSAPRFDEAIQVLEPLIENSEQYLSLYNSHAIMTLSNILGLQTEFVRQSELDTSEASTQLLIEICEKTQAEGYLTGGGAAGYQENEKILQAGLALVEQKFIPFKYGCERSFTPGLSVIDFLMHSTDWHYETAQTANTMAS